MAYGVIYRITCKLDGKPYVGQTVRTIEERFKEYARCKKSHLGNAIRAHGVENFTCEVIEECDTREQLNEREIFWIAELNCKRPNGYNLTDGGEGVEGFHCSEETKAKMSASHKGIPKSPETKAKISAAKKNPSAEARAKLSALNSGENNPNYGKHPSDETRAKMSAKRKGKRHTKEARAKIAAAKTGKPRSKETVRKMSIGRRGESHYKNLLAEMDARQITYSALAKLLGLTQPTISGKVSGRRNFTEADKAKLVEIFGKPIDYLLARE